MATATGRARCVTCGKEKSAVRCEGCLQIFCRAHLTDHCLELSKELDEIEVNRDVFRQTLNEQIKHPQKHVLVKQIDRWEKDSIKKIQQKAKHYKQILFEHTNKHFQQIETQLSKLTDQIRETRQENDFNEIDIKQLKEKLTQLKQELEQLPNVLIQQDSSSFINEISVVVSSRQMITSPSILINVNTNWKQYGFTIAGRNGKGNQLNQLSHPIGICLDDDNQCIYIADSENHRIVEWRYGANMCQVIGDEHGERSQINQLNRPRDVIIDKKTDSFIICDSGNRRIVRWLGQNGTHGQTIISDIDGFSLAMNKNGNLYVSDCKKNEVKQWKASEKNGTTVAGGNGQGRKLNQLNFPTFIFVDRDDALYVSDRDNHRVMKWLKDAKEGTVVAGGNGQGDGLTQLNHPQGITVDHLGNVYVADSWNNRIMCWRSESKEGRIIVGGNGQGEQPNQFNCLMSLSFDREDNLYVVDYYNHRIQKFDIDLN